MSTSPLLDLLGASWDFGAPVVAVAWEVDGGSIGFALGDGKLAVAEAEWPRGPRLEARPGGGMAVWPAEVSAPNPLRAACHPDSCLSLAADGRGGFLTGGDDGRVVYVPRHGEPSVVVHMSGAWIDALACNRSGTRALGSGRRVYCVTADRGEAIELPAPVTALAFSSDGRWLAAAHSGGVTLWSESTGARRLTWPGYHRALAWSPDGGYLVTGMQENAVHGWRVADGGDIEMGGYPGQPLSLSFAYDGRCLATSGGMRPVCWGFDPPAEDGPVECGIRSNTPVTCVACHPRHLLIAAGYHNGTVLLCQPGIQEGIYIKGSGGGAVNALAWSGDGSRLALGTQGGVFGWLTLPKALFRSSDTTRHSSKELTP